MSNQTLTDAELVQRVAEKVMGWTHLIHRLGDGTLEVWKPGSPPPGCPSLEWHPLTDWNDTWIVVEAMQGRGFYFSLSLNDCGGWVTFVTNVSVDFASGGLQRAILEAALKAVEASK